MQRKSIYENPVLSLTEKSHCIPLCYLFIQYLKKLSFVGALFTVFVCQLIRRINLLSDKLFEILQISPQTPQKWLVIVLADLRKGHREYTPGLAQNFFILMQFSTKICKFIDRPFGVPPPPSWKILDPPLNSHIIKSCTQSVAIFYIIAGVSGWTGHSGTI